MKPERLGPYRIVRVLGRGGMGTVYEAVNHETNEPAAIKILSVALAKQEDFRQRFDSEIATLRKLRHPNIVRLFGFGDQDGLLFYAMELVNGNSLQEELERGQLFRWREVARIGIETCRALRHAHDRGVIHRDIKPANLLLTPDGAIKLSDFGIARLFGSTGQTAAGNVLGTVEFMAPEQADSRAPGPRADLYSLGAVFFALLTGRPPFRASSPLKMLEKQRFAKPEPVRRYAPNVPAELEYIIAQLLEKDPNDRIANATILSRRLEAMLHAIEDLPDSPDADSGKLAAGGEGPRSPSETTVEGDEAKGAQAPLPHQPAGLSPTADSGPPLAAQNLPETRVTSAFRGLEEVEPEVGETPDSPEVAEPSAPEADQKPDAHFTAVDEEELDRVEADQPSPTALISPQTLALGLGLIAVGLTVWYFLRPPSADALFEQITSVANRGAESSLVDVEDEIHEFLAHYSEDPRCEQIRQLQRTIELDRRDRRFERGQTDPQTLLPIERMYQEAINYARLSPDLSMAKLQAILDLYADRTDDSGPTGQCLESARRRLNRLRGQIGELWADEVAELHDRLDAADRLDGSGSDENQQRANQMRQALIELYQDKPWAREAVQRARDALRAEENPPKPPQMSKDVPDAAFAHNQTESKPLEYWNDGMVEWWNGGAHRCRIPSFQYSITPTLHNMRARREDVPEEDSNAGHVSNVPTTQEARWKRAPQDARKAR